MGLNKNEITLTCSCRTKFMAEKTLSDLFVQMLNVLNHLQGSPHNMELPKPLQSTKYREYIEDRNTRQIIFLKRE